MVRGGRDSHFKRSWYPLDLCGIMSIYDQAGLERKSLPYPGRLFKMAVQQGRSERDAEAYFRVR